MNLTDNETIKALKCHIKRQCWNDCPNATEERQLLNRPCSSMIAEDALDLINRKQAVNKLQAKQIVELKIKVEQQKAEIENLTAIADEFKDKTELLEIEKSAMQHKIDSQKAEIDRLRYILVNFMGEIFDWGNKNGVDTRIFAQTAILGKEKDGAVKQIKSEAYKEFAERLKQSAFDCDVSFGYGKEHYTEAVAVVEIDNLVKEVVGE
jgi:hypothetical protein